MKMGLTFQLKDHYLLIILLSIGLTGGLFAFTPSYFSNVNVLIGLPLLPFAIKVTGEKRNNLFYLGLTITFALLAAWYHVRIFYFFTLAFFFLWTIELLVGRLNHIVLFLVIIMSPFFIQVVTILGFPLRLMLSDLAGELLKVAGVPIEVQGNMMMIDNSAFTVDEACMGLNMLTISMLMAVFILIFNYHVSRSTLGLSATCVFFIVVFILNLLTNLSRIITLVFFRIMPEDPLHELVGIFCLVIYVLVPLHFVGHSLIKWYGNPINNHRTSAKPIQPAYATVLLLVAVMVLFAGMNTEREKRYSAIRHTEVKFGEYSPTLLSDGISKIATDDLLIYVKTIPEFFSGEHTPLMCWKGSGYEFSKISTMKVGTTSIYKGIIENDDSHLYTAWWYTNGHVSTISQLDWRVRMLRGENSFCLVNITADDEQTLLKFIHEVHSSHPIHINTDL